MEVYSVKPDSKGVYNGDAYGWYYRTGERLRLFLARTYEMPICDKAEVKYRVLGDKIRLAGELKRPKEDLRRLSRSAAKREREQMLVRQATLEKDIKRLFPIPQKITIASQEE